MDTCHICGKPAAEFKCRDCGEPVCEDCCVPFTLQNQIDFTLCTSCHDYNEARRSFEYQKEEEIRDKLNEERKLRNEKRRVKYWKPENIKRRREAREERKRVEQKRREEMLLEAVSLVRNWFK